MLYLALTEKQLFFAEWFEKCKLSASASWMNDERWQELVDAGYCYCDGNIYRAHEVYSTPDFQMCEPDKLGSTSEAADRQFEEARWYLFDEGKLQL